MQIRDAVTSEWKCARHDHVETDTPTVDITSINDNLIESYMLQMSISLP